MTRCFLRRPALLCGTERRMSVAEGCRSMQKSVRTRCCQHEGRACCTLGVTTRSCSARASLLQHTGGGRITELRLCIYKNPSVSASQQVALSPNTLPRTGTPAGIFMPIRWKVKMEWNALCCGTLVHHDTKIGHSKVFSLIWASFKCPARARLLVCAPKLRGEWQFGKAEGLPRASVLQPGLYLCRMQPFP